MIRFLVDAQLPAALARWLTDRGHESQHVSDIALERASDREIWEYAAIHKMVVVTKVEDFIVLHLTRSDSARLLWVRLGNVRRAALLAALEPILDHVVAAFERGETLVEIA